MVVEMQGMATAPIQIVRKIYEVGWTRHSKFDPQSLMCKIRESAGSDMGTIINSLCT